MEEKEKNIIMEKMDIYSPENLAKKIGVTPQTIYRWRKQENIKNILDFLHFLKILEIDPMEILRENRPGLFQKD